jgi:hypothetical protein
MMRGIKNNLDIFHPKCNVENGFKRICDAIDDDLPYLN